MRLLLTLPALLFALTAPTLTAQPSSDEAAIRAVIAQETEGWQKFDPKQVSSLFTQDAVWQNPFGVRLHGSAEIEKFLTNLMARPGYRAASDTIPPKIIAVRFESPDVATVWSDESSKGQIDDATGKPMAPRHSWYLEVLVKRSGVWKIRESIISDQKTP